MTGRIAIRAANTHEPSRHAWKPSRRDASQEERSHVMKLGSLFTNEVVTAKPADSLATVAKLMEEHNVGTVVLAEGQRPVGIVTDRDLALALGVQGHSPQVPVQEVMTCPITTMGHHEGIFKATQHMQENAIRRLVVVDDVGRLVGLVSLDDLLLLLSRELNNLAASIRPEVLAVK
jgi:CBS domain-containing protein